MYIIIHPSDLPQKQIVLKESKTNLANVNSQFGSDASAHRWGYYLIGSGTT